MGVTTAGRSRGGVESTGRGTIGVPGLPGPVQAALICLSPKVGRAGPGSRRLHWSGPTSGSVTALRRTVRRKKATQDSLCRLVNHPHAAECRIEAVRPSARYGRLPGPFPLKHEAHRMSRYRFVVPVLMSLGALAGPSAAFGQVGISLNITIAPPALPVYVQPPIPAPGYIWTPGYWAYGPDGYYWVPGTWVQPPGSACCGRRATGAGRAASIPGTPATGGRMSASTAASITATAMAATATRAATGITARSPTTAPSTTSAMCTSPTSTTAPSSTTRPPT